MAIVRCLNGSGSRPGEIVDFPLDNSSACLLILYLVNGDIDFRKEHQVGVLAPGSDIIARIRKSPPCYVLESVTDGIIIETRSGSVHLPRGTFVERHFIHLRLEDVVAFYRQHLKIQIIADTEPDTKMPDAVKKLKQSDELDGDNIDVQVRSSLPDTDQVLPLHNDPGLLDADEETDSDADDETLVTSVTQAARTPANGLTDELTPATSTSRPTRLSDEKSTIEETPAKQSTSKETVSPIAFRTVPDEGRPVEAGLPTSSAAVPDPDSPLAKKGDSQMAATTLDSTIATSGTSQGVFTVRDSPRRVRHTYGKHGRKANATRAKHMMQSKSPEPDALNAADPAREPEMVIGDSEEENIHVATAGLGEEPIVDCGEVDETKSGTDEPETAGPSEAEPLSEVLHTSQVANEVASRSMHPRGTKRKLVVQAEMDDDDVPTNSAPKCGRKSNTKTASPSSSSTVKEAPSTAKIKPQGRTRASGVRRVDTAPSDEGIVVAATRTKPRAPCPQVKLPRNHEDTAETDPPSTLVGKIPKVLMSRSNVATTKYQKFLKSQGAHLVTEVPTAGSNFVCVTSGDELATSAKILRSVVLGKEILVDDWVIQSQAAGQLLATHDFHHPALDSSSTVDRRHIFEGRTLYFTHSLCQTYGNGWADVEVLAKEVGASRIIKGSARQGSHPNTGEDTIYFGNEMEDPDAATLMETEEKVVHLRDMLTQSVLRGELLENAEDFTVKPPLISKEKAKSMKGRKSR